METKKKKKELPQVHIEVTGSHRYSCLFGALSLGGKQLFRQYDKFNDDLFYNS